MKYFLYLLVVLVNFGFGAVFFIAAKRMSMAGANAMLVTGTMAAWAGAYALVSWGVSRIITEKNASRIMVSGGVLGMLSGIGFIAFQQVLMLYVWMFVLGFAGPLYCAPAQVLIKRVDTSKIGGGILHAAGKYTTSWSIGHAFGPFVAGFCWQIFPETGWTIPVWILAFAFAGMIVWALMIDRCAPPAEAGTIPEPDPVYRKFPDLVLLGWIFGGAGTFVVSVLRCYLPYKTTALGMERFYEGLMLALISAVQAVAAYLLAVHGKYWMYRVGKLLLLSLCGIGSLLMFAFGTSIVILCAASALFGVFSAAFYVYFVFMAMFSPRNSARNLSINEAVVGIVTCAGPLAGGAAAFAGRDVPFLLMAGVLLPVCFFVLFSTFRRMRSALVCENRVDMLLENNRKD